MLKMNLSRYVYFEALVKHISKNARKLTRSRQKIIDEIDDQIQRILAKQNGGYWPVTEGDKVFIHFLNRLKSSVQERIDKKALRELLSSARAQAEAGLKIVFFAQETSVWPSLASFYEECAQDERFITQLVYVPFKHPYAEPSVDYLKIYKEKMGLDIITHDQYDVSAEGPDIAVFVKPYDGVPEPFYITEIDKVIRRCVYIPYAFFYIPTDMTAFYGYKLPLHYMAWKNIAYSQKHYEYICRYGYRNGENAVVLGFPRFDVSSGVNGYKKDDITLAYEKKIRKRKVILWNTHHAFDGTQDNIGTFLDYRDSVFEYFRNHKNAVLLWRPHPMLFGALLNHGVMTEKEIELLKNQLSNEDNIILDESRDYINSFCVSDGMLTDGGPSMALEYIATGKPIYYTVKQNGYVMPEDSVAKCWYWINTPQDLPKHLDMFFRGEDPMKKERPLIAEKYIGLVDGRCGERIKNYIAEQIIKEETERAAFCFTLVE